MQCKERFLFIKSEMISHFRNPNRNRDSSVTIVTSCWRSVVRIPAGAESLQTGSEVHPASYTILLSPGQSCGIIKLTTHLHIASRIAISVAIPPLFRKPS
jgi:hypothetical protein